MPRPVKCHLTGEQGTSDTFVKIGGYYYKSQEIYDEDQRKKQTRRKLIDYVSREFLGYSEGQPFSTFLPRKLQELSFYDDALILQVFREQASTIHERFAVMDFANELNKISYMIGIVRNALPEALQRQRKSQTLPDRHFTLADEFDPVQEQRPSPHKGKDLSAWLEEEDF